MVFVVIYLLLTTTFLPWETFVSTALNVYHISTFDNFTVDTLDFRGRGSSLYLACAVQIGSNCEPTSGVGAAAAFAHRHPASKDLHWPACPGEDEQRSP
jgi:hypothetical protein